MTASMLPEQQFRLLTIPTEATVTVTGGRHRSPAPRCAWERRRRTPAEGADPTGVEPGGTPSASITCAVPAAPPSSQASRPSSRSPPERPRTPCSSPSPRSRARSRRATSGPSRRTARRPRRP
ncbi:hypothetical protein NKG05_04175 [Oerskovia sp. M15]